MPESRAPLAHLLRAAEEILRGAADALAIARGRIEAAELASDLRDALHAEHARWELRAADDAAARRVADLLAALREFVDPERPPPPTEVPRRPAERIWRTRRGARDAR